MYIRFILYKNIICISAYGYTLIELIIDLISKIMFDL